MPVRNQTAQPTSPPMVKPFSIGALTDKLVHNCASDCALADPVLIDTKREISTTFIKNLKGFISVALMGCKLFKTLN